MVVNLNTGEPIKLHEILPVSFSELMDILRNQLYVRYGSGDTEGELYKHAICKAQIIVSYVKGSTYFT